MSYYENKTSLTTKVIFFKKVELYNLPCKENPNCKWLGNYSYVLFVRIHLCLSMCENWSIWIEHIWHAHIARKNEYESKNSNLFLMLLSNIHSWSMTNYDCFFFSILTIPSSTNTGWRTGSFLFVSFPLILPDAPTGELFLHTALLWIFDLAL